MLVEDLENKRQKNILMTNDADLVNESKANQRFNCKQERQWGLTSVYIILNDIRPRNAGDL